MSNKDQVLVSILVPVWNEEKHIEESVGSVLQQTHANFELFLIDDGSEDETFNIIQRLATSDSRIKPLRNPKKGKVAAINHAFELSTGDMFVYFAGDDIMPPDSIENRVHYFLADQRSPEEPRVGYGQLQMMSEDKAFDGQRLPRKGNKGTVSGGTIIFNRKFAEKMYPVPEVLPNEDTWARLCAEHFSPTFVHVPHVSLFYRIHGGNSHNRYVAFSVMNEFLHKRYIAFDLFLKRFTADLNASQHTRLRTKVRIEECRYRGQFLAILLSRLSIKEKMNALFNCNRFFYWLKLKTYSIRTFFKP